MDPISIKFQEALLNRDLQALRSVPKTDLHCHGSLSMRRSALEDFAQITIPAPPSVYPTFSDFISYLKTHIHPHTDFREGFEFCLRSALKEAVIDGIHYVEMSLDLKFIDFYDSISAFIDLVRSIQEEFKEQIRFGPEIGVKRTLDAGQINEMVSQLIDSGLFISIDLYDDELAGDVKDFKDLFQYARANGLKLKAHTGEYNDALSIAQTVEILELDAIQHGINCVQDKGVMKMLTELRIPVHVCPTSNVALKRVKSLQHHPIREMFDHGVLVTINSDDITLFDQSVSDEFLELFRQKIFSAEELNQIRLNGILQENT